MTLSRVSLFDDLFVCREDLSWDEGCPLYVMGALAQLQLGPDALNLAGGRHGAARVATSIRKSLWKERRGEEGQQI